jgi:Flp pilus assembly protein TadD
MKPPKQIEKDKNTWVYIGLLVIAILIAYGKVLKAGFVSWDDLDYVFNIRDIDSGISVEHIKHWFSRNYLGNYQPLPVFTYALDHVIGGTNPFVYHLHSLVWHVTATLILYHFISKLQDNKWVAFFVALLFAIHPVQTESVSWIAARNKSMNAAFYFSAMCFYLNYLETKKKNMLLLVTLFGLLAYLCKATALALPLALIAVDMWLHRPLNNKKIWLEKLPLVLAGIPIAIATLMAQKDVNFLQHHSNFGWDNIVFAGYALVQYLVHLVFPFQLSVLYPYPKMVNPLHVACLVIAIVLTVLMIIAYKKEKKMWAGGILFFIVNLLPVLQLVQFGEQLMADRYLYIACIGLWFPLVYNLFHPTKDKFRRIGVGAITTVCLIFLIMTFVRNNIWLTNISFWSSVLDKFPESSVAHYSLGGAYMNEGNLSSAELHMNEAVKYDPKNYKAWRNKGSLNLRQSKVREALDALNKSIELYPYSKAYFTRAMLYHGIHNCNLALYDADKVLEQEPDNARAYYIKADCEEQLGKINQALENYGKAITYDYREPLFLIRRGILLAKNGNNQAALSDFDKALTLKPGDGELFYYRAVVRYNLGQNPCDDLNQALRSGYQQAAKMQQKICR